MTSLFLNSYFDNPQDGYGKTARFLKDLLWEEFDLYEQSENILNFCKPKDYIFRSGFTVGYTPWESDRIPESWKDPLSKVDVFWTTATWLQDVFAPYVKKLEVIPHGIEPEWVPFSRHYDDDRPFTFIHVGEPAVRKGGDIVLDVWHRHFQYKDDVRLVVKTTGQIHSRKEVDGYLRSFGDYDNVIVIDRSMSQAELWREYALADCMIYPTRGEGFGLIPFEALATGLPVIAPDKRISEILLDYIIPIEHTSLVESEYQNIHPGQWLEYNHDSVISSMEYAIDHIEQEQGLAYDSALEIHENYSWDRIEALIIEKLKQTVS